MEVYPKINAPFKRGDDHRLIPGDWSVPEFGYLADNEWEFTEKVDGTNIRIGLTRVDDTVRVEYAGRSNNAIIPDRLCDYLWDTFPDLPLLRGVMTGRDYRFRYFDIVSWMQNADLTDVTLFGEGYGPNIQSGGKYRNDPSFVLFDVKIGPWWLSRDNVNDIAEKLGIDSVPVVGRGTLNDAMCIVRSGIKHEGIGWKSFGNGQLTSAWGDFEAEGIVARPVVPLFDRKGHRITTKIKAVDFK